MVIAIIVTQSVNYNTSSMLRCKQIMNEFVAQGHAVYCFSPHADTSSKYYACATDLDSRIVIVHYGTAVAGKVYAGNTAPDKSIKRRFSQFAYTQYKKFDMFGSSIRYIKYRKSICKQIADLDCDMLLSFSHPVTAHFIASYCLKRISVPYIQQWGDPLTLDFTNRSLCPQWLKKRVEFGLLKRANRICYVSPLTCDAQKELFPQLADRMMFLPTPSVSYGFDKEPCKSKRLCIGYFGSYNTIARDIRPLYEAALQCPDIDFKIIGDGDVVLTSAHNIEILPRLSQNELAEHIKATDVFVCLMNRTGNQIPGKVYHDASSTKDILLIKDGEFGDAIEHFFAPYDHYTFVDNNVAAIKAVLNDYLTKGVPVRKPVEAFLAQNIARKLIAL